MLLAGIQNSLDLAIVLRIFIFFPSEKFRLEKKLGIVTDRKNNPNWEELYNSIVEIY
jgi:hypothetical protein